MKPGSMFTCYVCKGILKRCFQLRPLKVLVSASDSITKSNPTGKHIYPDLAYSYLPLLTWPKSEKVYIFTKIRQNVTMTQWAAGWISVLAWQQTDIYLTSMLMLTLSDVSFPVIWKPAPIIDVYLFKWACLFWILLYMFHAQMNIK